MNIIKNLRAESKMTQEAFAKYFEIPKRTIENWEGGVNKCPGYLVKLIEYRLRKENVNMKDYTGMKWGDLNEEEQEYLLEEAVAVDGRTGNKAKSTGDYIIDLTGGYSVSGHYEVTEDEDFITINKNVIIYKSHE